MHIEIKYNLNEKLAEKSITSILNAVGNSMDGLLFKEIEEKTSLSSATISKQIKYLLAEEAISKGLGNKYKITSGGITFLHKLSTETMIEKVPLSTMPITFGRKDEKLDTKKISDINAFDDRKELGVRSPNITTTDYNCNFGGTAFININAVTDGDIESVKECLNHTIGSVVNGIPSNITAGTIVFTFNRG